MLTENEMRSGCALVDFGADTTTISVYKNNILRYLSVLPLGGNTITRDITSLQMEEQDAEKLLQLGVDDLITDKPEIIAPLLARDKALDNRLLWLRDQIQELFAAPDAEETMDVEETIEDAIEDPEEVLDEA